MKTKWLSDFLRRLTVKPELESARPAAMPTDPAALKQMVRGILTTGDDEIDCDECFQQVDRFADMVLDGVDAAEAMPLVQEHLNRCADCREEFEALLTALRSMA